MLEKRGIIIRVGMSANIYPVGDTHIGAAACDEQRNKRLAETISADPLARVIGVGDYIEAIAPSDKRWSARDLPSYANVELLENLFYCQTMRFCAIYGATAGRWDALVGGNHELVAKTRHFFDPCAIIAEHMRTPYVGGNDNCCWIRYLLTDDSGKVRGNVTVFAAHGWAGGELKGGVALALQRAIWRKAADVVILAHSHQPLAISETVEMMNNRGGVYTRTRWGVVNYPLVCAHSYATRTGKNSPPVGHFVIRLQATTSGDVHITVSQSEI